MRININVALKVFLMLICAILLYSNASVLFSQEKNDEPTSKQQASAKERDPRENANDRGPQFEPREFGPGGQNGFPRGPVGPGGPNQEEIKIVKQFDKDGDKMLNRDERAVARKWLAKQDSGNKGGFGRGPGGRGPDGKGFGGFGPGGRGPFGGGERVKGTPGPQIKPEEVTSYPDEPLYSDKVVRTFFLTFENDDWEEEMAIFKNTDVEVPATLVVDGKTYPKVGVSFRGMSSFMSVPNGSKRSLNLSMDFQNHEQKLLGYKTLNLLNSNGDPSMMCAALYSKLVREHIPAPKVNFVKVVINGESWGVYASAQQFNKDFLKENFNDTEGTRWKAAGHPGADAGLRYLGDNVAEYKKRFEIKTKDNKESWKALVNLCHILNDTPAAKLEEKLSPILDIDEVLWFLAYDVALVNEDGYWTRASDYNLYLDSKGKFHVIPHDMNETFHASNGNGGPRGPGGPMGQGPDGKGPPDFDGPPPGFDRPQRREDDRKSEQGRADRQQQDRQFGPGNGDRFGGGRFGGGPPRGMMRPTVSIDPLVAIDSPRMPLRSKLLAVPKFRKQYMEHVQEIAEKQLDWKYFGTTVAKYRELIEKEVKADTRKMTTFEAFDLATSDQPADISKAHVLPLRSFADQRSQFLLKAVTTTPTR